MKTKQKRTLLFLLSKYISLKRSHHSICQSSSDPHISKEARKTQFIMEMIFRKKTQNEYLS